MEFINDQFRCVELHRAIRVSAPDRYCTLWEFSDGTTGIEVFKYGNKVPDRIALSPKMLHMLKGALQLLDDTPYVAGRCDSYVTCEEIYEGDFIKPGVGQ